MYQPYWVRGSKGYLVHIAHIPALLWKQNRVNGLVWDSVITTNEGGLCQIMISWQFGPCTFCTGHIGSGGPRAIWYTQFIYPLLWNEKSRLLPSLGFPHSHNRGRPFGRLCFNGSLDPKMYVPAIFSPWVQGLLGSYSSYTRLTVESKSPIWPSLGCWRCHKRASPVADYDFMAVQTLYCMYRPYWICGSKGYLIHKAHISPAVELNVAYMAKFGGPSFPQTRASLWQIMILWQFGPCTVCTSHIGSVGQRAIWYTQLIYPLLWNEKSRLLRSLGMPLLPQSRPSLWQIMLLWQFGPQTVCTRHIGSVGPRVMWYIKLIYPLLWN